MSKNTITQSKGDIAPTSSKNYYETLSGDADEEATTPSQSAMSKKERKKLKKLRKRASNVLIEGERSGLLTRSEYEEYTVLATQMQRENTNEKNKDENSSCTNEATTTKSTNNYSTKPQSALPANPSINLRKKCLGIEKVEGSTHRDVLSWLLKQKFDEAPQQPTSSKKRKRDDEVCRKAKDDVAVALPHWVSVHNPAACEQVAVLEVHVADENLDSYRQFLESCRSQSAFSHSQVGVATKWFQGHIPKSMSDTLMYFSNVKKEPKKNKANEDNSALPSKEEFVKRLEAMLLSEEEMKEQGYPCAAEGAIENSNGVGISRNEKLVSPDSIPVEKADEYVTAVGIRVEYQDDDDKSPYIVTPPSVTTDNDDQTCKTEEHPVCVFGLDCEMVLTEVGSELARVTLIKFEEFIGPKDRSRTTVLLDCLVKPTNRILDYLTKHSGVTAAMLEPVNTRLSQVQYVLASYLTPGDILIGHSLENDLRALHYIHPRVVDTSMIFRPTTNPNHRRFKFSLRHLSGTLLKKTIQTGSHCSEEDAQTALDLALLKAFKGDELIVPGFGDDQKQSLLKQKFVRDGVAAFIGPNHWLNIHVTKYPSSAHALNYESPHDCKKAMLAWMTNKGRAHLIWSKIDLEENDGSESPIETFRSFVKELVEKLPPKCVLLVAIQGGLEKARAMNNQRRARRDPKSTLMWSEKDEEIWKDLLSSTRIGYAQWFSAPTNNTKS